ncbi:hypothetical protein ANCCAN_08655 [Ancylostoma caninum]|uniref:Adenosine deaminase domain-containing protein n=1 Tax=Ancylostoma caninum TaxID=29170 RepID=A0A368GLZ2_ANCCA|nr:hypothetical protein ANCCAN_08655 [Ancylostoma caninum]
MRSGMNPALEEKRKCGSSLYELIINHGSVFKIFPLIQSLTTSREAVKTATIDVIKEFADDGVIYLELRSTPRATSEMSKQAYIGALIEGIVQGSRDYGLVTRLLLSIDRRQSVEEAEHTVEMAAAEREWNY